MRFGTSIEEERMTNICRILALLLLDKEGF